ncbi:hypothetical protein HDU98_000359 [Podochytrium sp. JEL0797]|nr:hypothetical protein HDU98_000359 [Podochytrium sp. JEL0797]
MRPSYNLFFDYGQNHCTDNLCFNYSQHYCASYDNLCFNLRFNYSQHYCAPHDNLCSNLCFNYSQYYCASYDNLCFNLRFNYSQHYCAPHDNLCFNYIQNYCTLRDNSCFTSSLEHVRTKRRNIKLRRSLSNGCAPPPAPASCPSSTNMWAGANSYFIQSLPAAEQQFLLASLQQAGVTIVRIFITQFGQGSKGTNAIGTPDLEMTTIGVYDDTILTRIDYLLSIVPNYGIKLIIALHDRWNLDKAWGTCDAYCQAYCGPTSVVSPGKCTLPGGAATFYTSPTAQKQYDNRIAHILNHRNALLGNAPWFSLSNSIYSFNIQNEAESALGSTLPNPDWWCSRANAIKSLLPQGSPILVSTGGNQNPTDAFIPQALNCPAIDAITVHTYGDVANLIPQMVSAQKGGKTVVMEEFGAQGAAQANEIAYAGGLMNKNCIPWMIWQVSSVTQPTDYEFSPTSSIWSVFRQYALAA